MRSIFGDQGNMVRNFWEQGNSVKVNFGEHLNLFLRNKGTTVNFHGEQGTVHHPPPPPFLGGPRYLSNYNLLEVEHLRSIKVFLRNPGKIFSKSANPLAFSAPYSKYSRETFVGSTGRSRIHGLVNLEFAGSLTTLRLCRIYFLCAK